MARSEQEEFWAGRFGDEYTARNSDLARVPANVALFSRVLARAGSIDSVLELGAGSGLNLRALSLLLPGATLVGLEINATAVAQLRTLPYVEAVHGSILDFEPAHGFDLVFTKGVLIHQRPDTLPAVYERMHRLARRYLALAEYHNPTPVEVPYRGHAGRLFKRDFAGELLDAHPDLRLVDYGFVYHRDRFPQDDLTWFLLEKR